MRIIGVLDSGIGGLTTCCEILKLIPSLNVIYYADNLNAPYGSKTADQVYRLAAAATEYLLGCGAELIVIACNTATAAAVKRLRAEYGVPFVGIEPAVKPAFSSSGDILYLATPLTVKCKNLDGCRVADTDCLATLIEAFSCNRNALDALAKKVVGNGADNIVLGCTHYTYLAESILRLYPEARVFDGGLGVARQVKRKLGAVYGRRGGTLFLHFSGRPDFRRYIDAFKSAEKFG